MINNKVKDMKLGLTVQFMKANITKAKNTERVNSTGQTTLNMTDNSVTTKFMAKEPTPGRTEGFTKVIGKRTRCRVKASSPGLMDETMLVVMLTIKRKDMDNLHGLTAESTLATGPKANNRARANIKEVMVSLKRAFGKTEEESDGSMMRE